MEFFGDFLFEAFFDDGTRGLAGPEAGNAGLAEVAADDLITLALDFFRRDFNAQGGDTFGLLLDNNVHGE